MENSGISFNKEALEKAQKGREEYRRRSEANEEYYRCEFAKLCLNYPYNSSPRGGKFWA